MRPIKDVPAFFIDLYADGTTVITQTAYGAVPRGEYGALASAIKLDVGLSGRSVLNNRRCEIGPVA